MNSCLAVGSYLACTLVKDQRHYVLINTEDVLTYMEKLLNVNVLCR
jgi:hypothetical protein